MTKKQSKDIIDKMEYETQSEQEMRRLGQNLGANLKGGEVIELVGDIGAGKTTLTKGIAAGMGIDEDVQSPSFTLSRVYDSPSGIRLAHYDFYRLSDPGILADELAEAAGDPKTVTVVEWAEIVNDVLPSPHTTISISSPTEDSRLVKVEGIS